MLHDLSEYKVGQTLYSAEVSGKSVWYKEYTIRALTEAGFWYAFKDYDNWGLASLDRYQKAWASPDSRKVFLTKDEALANLRLRKRWYVKHCQRRLDVAKAQMEVAYEGVELPKLRVSTLSELLGDEGD